MSYCLCSSISVESLNIPSRMPHLSIYRSFLYLVIASFCPVLSINLLSLPVGNNIKKEEELSRMCCSSITMRREKYFTSVVSCASCLSSRLFKILLVFYVNRMSFILSFLLLLLFSSFFSHADVAFCPMMRMMMTRVKIVF